jgi:hypothetical protein
MKEELLAHEILYKIHSSANVEKVGRILHSLSQDFVSGWLSWVALIRPDDFDSDRLQAEWATFNGTACPWGICDLLRLAGEDASKYALDRLGDADKYHHPLGDAEKKHVLRWLSGALGLPPIERWIQRGLEAGSEIYYLRLPGHDAEIQIGDARSVLSRALFERACYAQAGKRLEIDRKSWPAVCDWLALIVESQEIPEDTALGRLTACLEDYLEERQIQGKTTEVVENRWPFLHGGMIYIHVGDLMRHIRETRQVLREPYKTLKAYSWVRHTVACEGSTRSYYRVPIDAISVPQKVRNSKCS